MLPDLPGKLITVPHQLSDVRRIHTLQMLVNKQCQLLWVIGKEPLTDQFLYYFDGFLGLVESFEVSAELVPGILFLHHLL